MNRPIIDLLRQLVEEDDVLVMLMSLASRPGRADDSTKVSAHKYRERHERLANEYH